MASKDDVPGSKSARKISAAGVVRSIAERREAIDLKGAEADFARLQQRRSKLAILVVEAVQDLLNVNRELECLAERIATLETDPKAREAWSERNAKLRHVTSRAVADSALRIVHVLTFALLTNRTDEGYETLATSLDKRKARDWLIMCTAIRQAYWNRITDITNMTTRPLHVLQAVDERAAALTDEDVFKALKKSSASEATFNHKLTRPVGPEEFAFRLARLCGAFDRIPESTLRGLFKELMRDPDLQEELRKYVCKPK